MKKRRNEEPIAERLCEGGEKVRELVVAVNVRTVFLHRILYFQDG